MAPFFVNRMENQLTYEFSSSRTRSYISSSESSICSATPGYWRTMRSTCFRKIPNSFPYIRRFCGRFLTRGLRSSSWCLCLSLVAEGAMACGQLSQRQVGSLERGNSNNSSQFSNSSSHSSWPWRRDHPLCSMLSQPSIRKHRYSPAKHFEGLVNACRGLSQSRRNVASVLQKHVKVHLLLAPRVT